MNILLYVISTIILVSLSGALAPGPLTVATIVVGSNGGARSGLLVATGHMLVELPYVVLLALLVSQKTVIDLVENFYLKVILGSIAFIFIVYFGYLTFREGLNIVRSGSLSLNTSSNTRLSRVISNPLIVGVALTGLNPHFLAWWATIGLSLLLLVSRYVNVLSFIPIFYASHVWIDYAWLTLLAYVSRRGMIKLGRRYGYVLECLAVILVVLGTLIVVKLFFC